jgi:DNA-binding HxlR family transcriptional regulator
VKISELLQSPSIKILVYLHEKGQTRHSELEKLIRSRGTLAANLNDLMDEGLLARKVVPSKPIQTNYSLTQKGTEVAKHLVELTNLAG